MITDRVLRNRINKGFAFLTSKNQHWINLIEIMSLDMGKASKCALGQMFKSYWVGLDWLGITCDKSVKLGFNAVDWNTRERLNKLWKEEFIKKYMLYASTEYKAQLMA